MASLFLFHVLFMLPLLVRTPQHHLFAVRVEQHCHCRSPPGGVTLADAETNGRGKSCDVSVLCEAQRCETLRNEMRWKKKNLKGI